MARESNFFAWTSVLAFAAIFWIWHSPAFYDETLRNNVVYWLMHVTIFAAALALWVAVFSSTAALAFLLIFATCMQMSLLGALLTFAAVPLYSVHEFTTAAWGLTWLEDQQLGGLLMWVPAGLAAHSLFGRGVWRRAAPRPSAFACRTRRRAVSTHSLELEKGVRGPDALSCLVRRIFLERRKLGPTISSLSPRIQNSG